MTRILVTAAAAGYAVNASFGAAVAAGWVDNRRIRWVHHALFSATASLTVIAVAAGVYERRPAALALLPALGPLTALPYAGGRVRRHAALAGSAAPAYAAALVCVWRSH